MKYPTRSNPIKIGLAALLAIGLMFVLMQNAKAGGTASGTTISNSATAAYAVGGINQTSITSAAATFVVDNKVNLTVAKVADAPTIIPGSTKQALAYTVTNNGNTTQRYALAAVAGAATISSMSSVAIYLDVNSNNAWDAGDTLYTDASTFGDNTADASLKILIVADTPISATNGQTAVFSLKATTVDAGTTTVTTATAGADTAGVDVVFADIAGSATGDVARDGQHSVTATYTVASATLTVVKSTVLLCDPYNGVTNPKNIPGSITQWTIVVTNTAGAGADATLTTISDVLAATIVHDPGAAAALNAPTNAATCVAGAGSRGFRVTTGAARNLGGSAGGGSALLSHFTSASDADGVELNAATVTATFATILPISAGTGHASAGLLKAGETVSVIFNTVLQ